MPAASHLTALLLLSFPIAAQTPPQKADRIVIIKSQHRMTLYAGPNILHVYRIAIGRGPSGPKLQQGDNRTPEGDYLIDGHNPHSSAHRSLHLSYPNAEDRARAAKAHVAPGGDIMIHGLPNGSGYLGALAMQTDWTYGCIAVTDQEIEEIYNLVPNGTKVHIEP